VGLIGSDLSQLKSSINISLTPIIDVLIYTRIYPLNVIFIHISNNIYNRILAMASQVYDVIVVGGGAIGLGAAYEVAKAGKSTLVLEQSCLFNAAGSSNDLARMYRTM